MQPPIMLFRSQQEVEAHFQTFTAEVLPAITTLSEAIPYVRDTYAACHNCRIYNSNLARSGNFMLPAVIAWETCQKCKVTFLEARPTAPLSLDEAAQYITRALVAMRDYSRRDFWDWYWQECVRKGSNMLEEQLVEVKRAWLADTSGTPHERARKFLGMLRRRFQFMHDLCEVPRGKAFDYGHVAQVAHGAVADALPKRPPAPDGRRSFTNLLTDLNSLEARLNGSRPEGADDEGETVAPDAEFIARVLQTLGQSAAPMPRDALLTAADLPVGGRSYGKLTWMADNGLVFSGSKGFSLKPSGRKPRKKS